MSLALASSAWGQVSAVEQAADEAVALYYTYQGVEPTAEQLAAGRSAALVLLAEGYPAEDLTNGVVQSFQEIAGAATAPFEVIVPPFVRANFTVGGATEPPPPPPPTTEPPPPPPPDPEPVVERDHDDDDDDDDDRGGSVGKRVASKVLAGVGIPFFAVGYGLTMVAGGVIPAVNDAPPGPYFALAMIPLVGPMATWGTAGQLSNYDDDWAIWGGLAGTLTFMQGFGFTFMMIAAGLSASSSASLDGEDTTRRLAIRDVWFVPSFTPASAGGSLTFRW